MADPQGEAQGKNFEEFLDKKPAIALLNAYFDAAYPGADNVGMLSDEGRAAFLGSVDESIADNKKMDGTKAAPKDVEIMRAFRTWIETAKADDVVQQLLETQVAALQKDLAAKAQKSRTKAVAVDLMRDGAQLRKLENELVEIYEANQIPLARYIERTALINAAHNFYKTLELKHARGTLSPQEKDAFEAYHDAGMKPVTPEDKVRIGLVPHVSQDSGKAPEDEPADVPPAGEPEPEPNPKPDQPRAAERLDLPEWHTLPVIGALLPVKAIITSKRRVSFKATYVSTDQNAAPVPVSISVKAPLEYAKPGERLVLVRVLNRYLEGAGNKQRWVVEAEPIIPKSEVNSRVKPIDIVGNVKTGLYFLLPDGSRMLIEKNDLSRVNPETGTLLKLTGEDTGILPKIQIKNLIGTGTYAGVIEPLTYAQNRLNLEAIMRQYIFGGRAIRNLSQQDKDFVAQIERLGLLVGEGEVPESIGARLRDILDKETRKDPQYIVVSAQGRLLHKGFDAMQQYLEKFVTENPSAATQATELIAAAQLANQAMLELEQAVKTHTATPELQEKYTADYVSFFEKLYAFEQSTVAAPHIRARTLRRHFFPSDADGETSNAMLQKVGIHTLVIPQLPNIVPEGVANVEGAAYLDASHTMGTLLERRNNKHVIFLDEDERAGTLSATHATFRHLKQMGLIGMDAKELGALRFAVGFINAYDSFAGPYEKPEGLKAIFDNYHLNLYGVHEVLIKVGRFDLILAFFEKEMPKIYEMAQDRMREDVVARRTDTRTIDQRVLDILVTYDTRPFFENIRLPPRFFEEMDKLVKSRDNSVRALKKLEADGFVIQTDFGKTVIDIAEYKTMDDGKIIPLPAVKLKLAAFAQGYDAYVGYTPEGPDGSDSTARGMVNIRPGLHNTYGGALKLPPLMAMDVTGKSKGNVIKEGRMFVSNATSSPLYGLYELLDALHLRVDKKFTPALEAALKKDFGDAPPPPPGYERFEGDRRVGAKFLLQEQARLEKLRPENLDYDSARLIVADQKGLFREMFAQQYVGHSELNRAIFESIYSAWWKNHKPDVRKAYQVQAAQIIREHELAERARELIDANHKVMARFIYQLPPRDRIKLYAMVRDGKDVMATDAFVYQGENQKAAWKKYLSDVWFASLTPQQINFYEQKLHGADVRAARLQAVREQIAHIEAELQKYPGTVSRGGIFSFGKTRQTQPHTEELERQRLLARLKEARIEAQGLATDEWLDSHVDAVDGAIDRAARRRGWDVSAVDSGALAGANIGARVGTSTVGGAALVELYGAPEYPQQVATSPILLAAAEAARQLRARGLLTAVESNDIENPTEALSAPAVSAIEHVALLQQQIAHVFPAQIQKYGSLDAALKHEPLKGLYDLYRSSLDRATAVVGERTSKEYYTNESAVHVSTLLNVLIEFYSEIKSPHLTFEETLAATKDANSKAEKTEKRMQEIMALNKAAREAALKKGKQKKKDDKNKNKTPEPEIDPDKPLISDGLLKYFEHLKNTATFDIAYSAYTQGVAELEKKLGPELARHVLGPIKKKYAAWAAFESARDPAAKADARKAYEKIVKEVAEVRKNETQTAQKVLRTSSFYEAAIGRMEAALVERVEGELPHLAGLFNASQKSGLVRVLTGDGSSAAERAATKPLFGASYRKEVTDHRFEYEVKPFDRTPLPAVTALMAQMHPELQPAEAQNLAFQFLGCGTVKDSARQFDGSFLVGGEFPSTLYAGDVLIARRDEGVKFGFMIEIHRAEGLRAEERPGRIEYDYEGKPEFYYEQGNGDAVDVWRYDAATTVRHKIGSFDAEQKFTPYKERFWEFTDVHGEKDKIIESDTTKYFTPDGSVIEFRENPKTGELIEEKIGSVGRFEQKLTLDMGDGLEHEIDTRAAHYYIDPRGTVWEYDPLLGLQELGALKARQKTPQP